MTIALLLQATAVAPAPAPAAAPAALPVPIANNVQLVCTLAMPGSAPAVVNVDLKTSKPGTAAISAEDKTWLSRITKSSEAVGWPTGTPGTVAFVAGTGAGQYRVELAFAGAPDTGNARARIVVLDAAQMHPLAAQGFCTRRDGKRISTKNLSKTPFDAAVRVARPITLQPVPNGLTGGTCRVVAADRRVHQLGYTIAGSVANEASVSYRADDPTLLGSATAAGMGVQFHLVSPGEHLVALTVSLDGTPPVYVHTTFERSGNWIDIRRDGAIVAQGECGPAIPAMLAAAEGNTPR